MAWRFGWIVLVVACLAPSARAQDNPEFTHPEAIRAAIDEFIVPAYADFAVGSKTLRKTLDGLCRAPSPTALTGARAAFAETVSSWSTAEIVRFGPAITLGRMERIAFWPDRKGIGARHLRRALRNRDPALLAPGALQHKSAALQGLTALEMLLHGKRADQLATPDEKDRYACALAAAIAANLVSISERILAEWIRTDPFRTYMLEPGFHNPYFRDSNSVPATLLSSFAQMLEAIRDKKLLLALGRGDARPRPRRTQWWRSGLGAKSLRANFVAIKLLYAASGWKRFMPDASAQAAALVESDLERAILLVSGLHKPLDRAILDETDRQKLLQLAAIARTLQTLTSEETAKALGVVLGFSWVDGD